MKLARDFYRPLAIGAPLPWRELPSRLERMIHFVPPHVFLQRRAEDHAEDEWPRWTIEPLENEAERAEPGGQKDIENLAVDAVNPDTTEQQDRRIEQAVGNPQQPDPKADHRQLEDQQHHVADQHAGDDGARPGRGHSAVALRRG